MIIYLTLFNSTTAFVKYLFIFVRKKKKKKKKKIANDFLVSVDQVLFWRHSLFKLFRSVLLASHYRRKM